MSILFQEIIISSDYVQHLISQTPLSLQALDNYTISLVFQDGKKDVPVHWVKRLFQMYPSINFIALSCFSFYIWVSATLAQPASFAWADKMVCI